MRELIQAALDRLRQLRARQSGGSGPAKPPSVRASEPEILVFLSSVMTPEMRPARDRVVETLEANLRIAPWAFEKTPASSAELNDSYLRKVRDSAFVIWLASQTVTDPVKAEVAEALSSRRRLIVIRYGDRDSLVDGLLEQVKPHCKWADASDLDELAVQVELAIGDEIARALNDLPGMGRTARLQELMRASRGRCMSRWMAVGLPRTTALSLAHRAEVGELAADLRPSSADPVRVVIGELGSGKSIAGERLHQRNVEAASNNASRPAPVWLSATEAVELKAAVEQASAGLGNPGQSGAALVVDGLDELGHDRALELLTAARALTVEWPSTTVVLLTRPLASFSGLEERVRIPDLTDEEIQRCLNWGAGGDLHGPAYWQLDQAIKQTLTRPFFALLTGVWMAERGYAPRAPVDLLGMLGARATAHVTADEAVLRRLGVLSVRRELGPVPSAEIASDSMLAEIESSGILLRHETQVGFALPALTQWFAGQALLAGDLEPAELLNAPEDLTLWEYPLALALASSSADGAHQLMRPLLEQRPGFAARVLDKALGQARLEGSNPPPWREGGEQVRSVAQALANALGPLGGLTFELDQERKLVPLGVASSDLHLTVATWSGLESRPPVFPLPPELNLWDADWRWGTIRMATCGPTAAWAWGWVRDGLRKSIDDLLKERGLPIPPDGPLAEEQVWATAIDIAGLSNLDTEQLQIVPLLAKVDPILAAAGDADLVYLKKPGRGEHALGPFARKLRELQAAGESVLRAPLPCGDLDPGGGWIGEFYTPERLVEIASETYLQATAAYSQLVEKWFPAVAADLEHVALLPVKVVGFVSTGKSLEESGFGPIPSMSGWLQPLPPDEPSTIDIAVREFNFDYGNHIYELQRRMRPQAARWISGSYGGMSFDPGDRYPVREVVYSWLRDDLHRLGLTSLGTLLGGRSNHPGVWL